MDKEKQITMIRKTGVVAIIRAETSGDLVEAAEAINAGGLNIIEVTMTTPDSLNVIAEATEHFGDQVFYDEMNSMTP